MLLKDRPFPVLRAERPKTRCGTTVLLTLKESAERCVKIFHPKHFTQVFTDNDIDDMNEGMVAVCLIYRGTYEETSAYLLSVVNLPLIRVQSGVSRMGRGKA
jgi:hypothetical protein